MLYFFSKWSIVIKLTVNEMTTPEKELAKNRGDPSIVVKFVQDSHL